MQQNYSIEDTDEECPYIDSSATSHLECCGMGVVLYKGVEP
jgi:hypothetical protein